jgi:putative photosynthetic complex assembly protein 2
MNSVLSTIAGPALCALFSWWFSTGIILWLVRRPVSSFRASRVVCTLLFVLSLVFVHRSMQAVTVFNAYLGFLGVILMWGWHEFAFLSGWVMGPRRVALESGAHGWKRFAQSTLAVLHHELLLLLNFLVLLALQTGQPNYTALCTFALLWCMRLSAKLNLFFGVREVGEQYLPGHLVYLASYFRRGQPSAFFFVTMGVSAGTWLWMVMEVHSGVVAVSAGWVLLSTLLGLAILEHVIMMFPLPMQRLWGWAMSTRRSAAAAAGVLQTRTDEA